MPSKRFQASSPSNASTRKSVGSSTCHCRDRQLQSETPNRFVPDLSHLGTSWDTLGTGMLLKLKGLQLVPLCPTRPTIFLRKNVLSHFVPWDRVRIADLNPASCPPFVARLNRNHQTTRENKMGFHFQISAFIFQFVRRVLPEFSKTRPKPEIGPRQFERCCTDCQWFYA